MNTQVGVIGKELFHSGAFMPGSIVRPKINGRALETGYDLGKHLQESICVSSRPFHNAMEAIERIDPAEEIKALLVLTLGVDVRLRSLLSPDPPELRVQGEPGFIFKKHHPFTVAFSGEEEFFLPRCEIRLPPSRWPECIGTSVVAGNSPISLSCAGRAAPEPSRSGIFLNIRQPQRRPNDFEITRNPEVIWTALRRDPSILFRRIEKVYRNADDPQLLRGLPGWLSESTSQHPIGSIQRGRQFAWISNQSTPANMQRSGYRPMPRVSPPPYAEEPLGLILDAITSVLSSSPSRK